MFLSDMYSRLENNNSLEGGTSEYVEKQDWYQSKCPSMIEKIREGGSSSLYSGLPSIDYVRQSQHALIGDNISEGDSDHNAYAHPLNSGNVMSNSFSVHHETSGGETENNSTELNPSFFCKDRNLGKQDEPAGLSQDEGSNVFLENRDLVVGKASSFTAVDKKGKKKPRKAEVSANIPAELREHKGFRVTRTEKHLNPSLISRPSGSKDRHTMVLTSKGPRDRRMRLSVGTAIKLYCIQDMLGFEQPSQAVEWLIEKSQEAIQELPQVASISSSHTSQYVDSTTVEASLSRLQTGDLRTSSKENTFTANGDCLVNQYQQILEAKTWIDQKSSTATTTESNNKSSIVQEAKRKRDHRSLALSSVVSNRRTRETANSVFRKLFRAKARERARERTKQKEKHQTLEKEKCSILQSTLARPQSPTSCLNMMNETTDGDSNSNAFLPSLMFTKDSMLDSESRLCRSPPPAEIRCSSLASARYYTPQQEGISLQSTGAFSGLHPGSFHLPSAQFPQAVSTPNTNSSQSVFCPYPLDHEDLQSNNLTRCCTIHSIEMPCSYDGGLDSLYGRQSSSHKGSFPEFK